MSSLSEILGASSRLSKPNKSVTPHKMSKKVGKSSLFISGFSQFSVNPGGLGAVVAPNSQEELSHLREDKKRG